MPPKAVTGALLALLIVLSGCSGTPPTDTSPSDQDCAIDSLAFWRVGEYHGWESDTLRVGYELSGKAELLLVASENDTVLGETRVTSDQAVAADGAPIPLDVRLDGEHTVRVAAYKDTNGDGQFDPQTDKPCSVQTDSLTVDFSALDGTATET